MLGCYWTGINKIHREKSKACSCSCLYSSKLGYRPTSYFYIFILIFNHYQLTASPPCAIYFHSCSYFSISTAAAIIPSRPSQNVALRMTGSWLILHHGSGFLVHPDSHEPTKVLNYQDSEGRDRFPWPRVSILCRECITMRIALSI